MFAVCFEIKSQLTNPATELTYNNEKIRHQNLCLVVSCNLCTSIDGSWTDISFAVQLADVKFGLWPDYEIQASPKVSPT